MGDDNRQAEADEEEGDGQRGAGSMVVGPEGTFEERYVECEEAGVFGFCLCSCVKCKRDVHCNRERYCSRLSAGRRQALAAGAYDFRTVSEQDVRAERVAKYLEARASRNKSPSDADAE